MSKIKNQTVQQIEDPSPRTPVTVESFVDLHPEILRTHSEESSRSTTRVWNLHPYVGGSNTSSPSHPSLSVFVMTCESL